VASCNNVTPSGIVIDVILLQFSNAEEPIEVILLGKETEVAFVHPEKALEPSSFTPSGITIEDRDEQPENAELPIAVTLCGIETDVILQDLNALAVI
jgi:hypothetical protein